MEIKLRLVLGINLLVGTILLLKSILLEANRALAEFAQQVFGAVAGEIGNTNISALFISTRLAFYFYFYLIPFTFSFQVLDFSLCKQDHNALN